MTGARRESDRGAAGSAIAIIGMACEFPGAHSPEELWENVLAGRREFRKAPIERLPPEYFSADPLAPGRSYCDQMAVIEGWRFDPLEFRIPPVTCQASDVAHWLALFTARAAFRDAGLDLGAADRTRIGVVLGNTLTGEFARSHNLRHRWPYAERAVRGALEQSGLAGPQLEQLLRAVRERYEAPLPEITEDSLAGNMANTIAGRICGYFDLGGGGYTVDGACSSSLLSIAHACAALVNGEIDVALAGGVDVSLDPFEIVGFAKARALAADDIRPYDERAAGMIPGEGCGLFVLMRAADAGAAGARIRALIRGWGISSDGAGGITAPEVEGQARALRRAYERAGYPISTVDLIEGHGTGTTLGDKVEIAALLRLLESTPEGSVCRIGSIKAQIGHCKAAAGAAGLVKAVMALERKVLPPTTNCQRPSPAFGSPPGRLRPNLRGGPWTTHGRPRRASVSSMGFGGANSHLALEEADPAGEASAGDLALLGSGQTSELVLLSAENETALRGKVERLLPIARRISRAELIDLSAALAASCRPGGPRLAIVAGSPWELADSLERIAARLAGGGALNAADDPSSGIFAGTAGAAPRFVALFPGQGSQRLAMGEHLHRRFPFVRELYAEVAPDISRHVFRDTIGADGAALALWDGTLRETRVAQPAIVLSSIATLRVLSFLGLDPDISLGHSLGDITALHAAGAFDAATAVRLAAARGEAMGSLPLSSPGAMLAIGAAPATVEPLVAPFAPAVVVSNYNSPRQTVVSGDADAIARLASACAAGGVPCQRLPVSHAFHSDHVAPAARVFRLALEREDVRPLSGRCVSSSTGASVVPEADLRDLLARQIRQPVRFVDAVGAAAGLQPALWIEVGPGAVLTAFVREILGDRIHCLPTDVAGRDGFDLLNRVLARAFVVGLPVRTDRLFAHRFHRAFDLERYDPVFIVNPCERPAVGTNPVEPPSLAVPAALRPEGIGEATFADYLARRGGFLRELIAVDCRHHAADGAPTPTGSPSDVAAHGGHPPHIADQPPSPAPEAPGDAAAGEPELLAFAVEWIARRTGFPESSIGPDRRLRDDLNLDSIKAGELLIQLSRRADVRLIGDLASLANATIRQAVEAVLNAADAGPEDAGTRGNTRALSFDRSPSIREWVRTFAVRRTAAPLAAETPRPLPAGGSALVLSEASTPQAAAVAEALRLRGLSVIATDPETVIRGGNAPGHVDLLILVLSGDDTGPLECTAGEFESRVGGVATLLFQLFRRVLSAAVTGDPPMRGLVLRPAGDRDAGSDLDAGAALLKSVMLEYPGTDLRWVSLPARWGPGKWADTTLEELQHTGPGEVAYSADGARATELAVPAPLPSGPAPPPVGGQDVVLVSGGGKGITFELAFDLSRRTRCKLVLLGSSPPPGEGLQESSELGRNLAKLRQARIAHTYVQADVTDFPAVRRAVAHGERQLGRITGILHGAGITELHLMADKPLEEFQRCVRIKATGLHNLLAAVPPERLKILHATSSVLGHTGMRAQTDYTFANAWLDRAVRQVKALHPHIHCLSLGYSVWEQTGLGRRIGALESLRAVGVTPISVEEGVTAYRRLLDAPQSDTTFVITGRLTSDLEANLHAQPPPPQGRFLEQVLRWVPQVEIVAESRLAHSSDWYLPEHVFEGTPIVPGVMAIEAMVQAAMACACRHDLPVLRHVAFHRPLIVPDDAGVVVRTLALAEPTGSGPLCVRAAVRSGNDGFHDSHFEAECWFGVPAPGEEPACPPLPDLLAKDPEDFHPVPLFQGRFFRRIAGIREATSDGTRFSGVSDLAVPHGERYYAAGLDQGCRTFAPCLRDACLQSAALLVPPGVLPERIDELRILRRPAPGDVVHCAVTGTRTGEDTYTAEYALFDAGGRLLEQMRGVSLRRPAVLQEARRPRAPAAISAAALAADLSVLLPDMPPAVAIVRHASVADPAQLTELAAADVDRILAEVADPRRPSAMANLVAARRAVRRYAREHLRMAIEPTTVSLVHLGNGKPHLAWPDASARPAWHGIDVTLTDSHGISLAVVGRAPLGVDVEPVAPRDAETWRGLLGDDGYELALRIGATTGESFDVAATRVWAALESGRKANGLRRSLPALVRSLRDSWLSLDAGDGLEWLSAVFDSGSTVRAVFSLTFMRRSGLADDASELRAPAPPVYRPAGGTPQESPGLP